MLSSFFSQQQKKKWGIHWSILQLFFFFPRKPSLQSFREFPVRHPILIMSWSLLFSIPRIQCLAIFWGSHVNELFRREMMERETTERACPAFKGYIEHAHRGLHSCSCFMHLGWYLKYRRANSLASDELSFHLENQKAWNGGQSRRETCLIRTSFSESVGNTTVLPKLGQVENFDPSSPQEQINTKLSDFFL